MTQNLVATLASAHRRNATIPDSQVPTPPASVHGAYAAQLQLLSLLGDSIGGWKVGAKSPQGPVQGAPLPQRRLLASPVRLQREDFPMLGIELELAFSFSRRFDAWRSYATDEVLGAITSVRAAIEIVSSRYAQWPAVDPLLQLSDLQNHGALVLGEAMPYSARLDFLRPEVTLHLDGQPIALDAQRNPAGDPRRLLTQIVNHSTAHGLALAPEQVVTTGSYTGLFRPPASGVVEGRIAGLPAVSVELA